MKVKCLVGHVGAQQKTSFIRVAFHVVELPLDNSELPTGSWMSPEKGREEMTRQAGPAHPPPLLVTQGHRPVWDCDPGLAPQSGALPMNSQ